ncbi:MAG TPA: alpha/beta hydrolase-fold protein [Pedobacter sp.]|jgi:predicted alpha/beta superfamily hydrolase
MKLLITLFLLVNLSNFASAQDKSDSVYSEVLKEKRLLKVILPPDYKPGSQKKYDVAYILDGETTVDIFSQVQAYAKGMGFMPNIIMVGLTNVDRTRDFTPTVMKRNPTSGGADKFISFLKQELIPYINKTYLSSGQNILYGHSLGGLVAVHAMLTEPALFSSYVAAEPSLWYDNGSTNKLAIEKFKTLSQPGLTLFISSTNSGMKRMGITTMDSILKIHAPQTLTHKIVGYDGEHHGSVHLKTIYDALKFIYTGFNLPGKNIEYHPMNGIVLKNKPYIINVKTNFPEFRYTTNGTPPTSASPKIEKINTFTGPVQLTIKSFSTAKFEKTVTGNFVLGEALAPVTKSDKFKSGGLSYSYYEGLWDSLPNYNTLKLVKTGIADKDFNFSKLPTQYNYALAYKGLIEIKKEGYYLFSVGADDGAKLYLKDKLIINDDRPHHAGGPGSFLIPLKKGFYPIRLEFFQRGGDARLRFKYMVPGEKELIDIPSELLYNDHE